MTFVSIIAL